MKRHTPDLTCSIVRGLGNFNPDQDLTEEAYAAAAYEFERSCEKSLIETLEIAYKDSSSIMESQPYLIMADQTVPIATVKFTEI